MITRVRLALVAAALLLVSASVGFAQQADTSAAAGRYGFKPVHGAIGFQVGLSRFAAGGDYSKGASPRLSISGSYRYVASPAWGWQVSPYFTWTGYVSTTHMPFDLTTDVHGRPFYTSDGSHYLTQMVGADGQLLRFKAKGANVWHVGFGPGIYRVVVQRDRDVVKDTVSTKLHQGTYLGLTAEVGVEHFLGALKSTSLEYTLGWHMAYAKRDDQFPTGFNAHPQVFEARFGAHYYFDLVPKKKDTLPVRKR